MWALYAVFCAVAVAVAMIVFKAWFLACIRHLEAMERGR